MALEIKLTRYRLSRTQLSIGHLHPHAKTKYFVVPDHFLRVHHCSLSIHQVPPPHSGAKP